MMPHPILRLCMLNPEPAERRLLAGAATAQAALRKPVMPVSACDVVWRLADAAQGRLLAGAVIAWISHPCDL